MKTFQALELTFAFAEIYKLIRLGRRPAAPVAACRKACSEYSLGFMPLGNLKEDLRFLSRLPEYRQDRLIITDGIEKYYNQRSSLFTFPSGKEVTGVPFTKGGMRVRGFAGTYCMNIYYGKYVSRDCVVDTNDLCACKRGEFIFTSKRLQIWSLLTHDACAGCPQLFSMTDRASNFFFFFFFFLYSEPKSPSHRVNKEQTGDGTGRTQPTSGLGILMCPAHQMKIYRRERERESLRERERGVCNLG